MISKLGQPLEIIYLFKVAFTHLITVSHMSFQQLYKGDGKDVNSKRQRQDLALHVLYILFFISMSCPRHLQTLCSNTSALESVFLQNPWPLFSITESSMLMTARFLNSSHFQLHHTYLTTNWIFSLLRTAHFHSALLLTQSPNSLLPSSHICSIYLLP